MSETQTYYVIVRGNEYISDAEHNSSSPELWLADTWRTRDDAEFWISRMARNWDLPYVVKVLKMTVEDSDGQN